MALINSLTKQDFDDKVLKSKKVVLVDFWADWCPPCRAMAPILEKTAERLDDKADVVKVDIEANPENKQMAINYAVQSIPNMVIFKDGQEVDRIIGLTQQNALEDRLNRLAKS